MGQTIILHERERGLACAPGSSLHNKPNVSAKDAFMNSKTTVKRRTVAIIACADTKKAEMEFLRALLAREGFGVLTIDLSTQGGYTYEANVTPREIAMAGGSTIEHVRLSGRAEAISVMEAGVVKIVSSLSITGNIDGALGIGGLQNSRMASAAMRALPVGVPKLILSTVACGNRPFELLVGDKDITVMPSVADIAGLNPLTETVLTNAAAAVMGMVQYGGKTLSADQPMIAASMMGATNDGVVGAVRLLELAGKSVVTFHSTGVGGRCLEQLVLDGMMQASLDLSPHEIISQDVFGFGFSAGAANRLCAAAKKGISSVVAPGGMDFVDVSAKDFFAGILGDPAARKYVLHNSEIAHVKLTPEEAARGAAIFVERLNRHTGKLSVILPLQGLRSDTRQGQKLYDPAVDQAIFDVIRKGLRTDIRLVELDAHFFDEAFSVCAFEEMMRLLQD
ncbi:MAG TPA: Tm-1-like ATP-binding domain-containing protein [Clostridia bacterium]|nr:Tm-1-like ATP-binding domain-containing protein [Clostridia bacterium]